MKFYGSKKVYRVESIQGSNRSPEKLIQMKKLNRLLSIFSKAINYGRAEVENNEDGGGGGGRNRSRSHSRQRSDRPPSAPSQRKPPIIRIRRERSLNGVMWGSPQQVTSDSAATNETYLQDQSTTTMTRRSRKRSKKNGHDVSPGRGEMMANNLQTISPAVAVQVTKDTLKVQDNSNNTRSRSRGSVKESYSPEAERFVKAAISDIAIARPVERQIIRLINGNDPSIQSQVLLNTKTSQPWEDLVRDLGMAVKLVRGIRDKKLGKFYLETISGRKIQSYSQLRSELMAGTHAFYVYAPMEDINDSLPSLAARLAPALTPTNRSVKGNNNNNKIRNSKSVDHLPGVDRIHTGATINVQAELGKPPANFPRVNSTPRMANATTQEPSAPPATKHVSKPSMIPVPKKHPIFREASSMTELTILVPSSRSNPSFQLLPPQKTATKKRETRKKRSEASGYLAPGSSRSRSVSP